MQHRLIGITGRAGAGKDTICEILQNEFRDYDITRVAFADKLKESAMRSLGLDPKQADAVKEDGKIVVKIDGDKHEISGRHYLQLFGAEGHRDVFGKQFWINAAFEVILPGVTVVTDVRFDNEAEAIKELGGVMWKVTRPEADTEDKHTSESGVSHKLIDMFIENDGTLPQLRTQVMWAWGATPTLFGWTSPTEPVAKTVRKNPFDYSKYSEEELKHNYLKRKEIADREGIDVSEIS